MWDFVHSNWQSLILVLVVLACPLLHALGPRAGHRHRASGEERDRPTGGLRRKEAP